jgi:uncharacterized membrane protein
MPKRIGGLCKSLAVLACLIFPLMAHMAVSGHIAGPLRLALLALPLLAMVFWAVTRPASRGFWIGVLMLTGAAVYALERQDREGLVLAYGLPHAAAYLFLLWFFGRTLASGREALITRVARRVHGPLAAEIETYTRRVTAAWCIFFASQLAVSLLLFAFAPVQAWSLFVNVLNVPLLVLMFAGEYGYRVARYPDHPRASLASTLRAFANHG